MIKLSHKLIEASHPPAILAANVLTFPYSYTDCQVIKLFWFIKLKVRASQEAIEVPKEEGLRDIILEPDAADMAPQPTNPVTNKELLYK